MSVELDGKVQVVLADHAMNLQAWRTPDDWLYGPPTSSGEFFLREMGDVHITQQDGKPHRRSRKLLLPGFGINALGKNLTAISHVLETGLAARAGSAINLHSELSRLYTAALSRSQVQIALTEVEIGELVAFEEEFISGLALTQADQLRWHTRPEYLQRKAAAFALFERIVGAREQGTRVDDTLQQLITPDRQAAFEPLTHQELLNVVYLLLVAGVGNIAVLACCMYWSLQQQPAWRSRLQEELVDFDPAQMRGGLKQFPQLMAVVAETERCFLPAPITPKITAHTIDLAGYEITAGTHVLQLHGMSHFDATRYPDPYSFKPERWLMKSTPRANAYGGGTHLCLGMGVSRVFLPLTLAHLINADHWSAEAPPQITALRPDVSFSPPITRFNIIPRSKNAGG